MNKFISVTLIALSVLIFSSITQANESTLREQMFIMGRSLVEANNAQDTKSFKNDLDQFIQAAENSKSFTPRKLKDDPEKLPDYRAGLQDVINLAKHAETLAEQGDLDAAKQLLSQMSSLRRKYHQEYK